MSLSDWYLTPWLPLEKNSSKSTPLCGPPVVGPIGLSPGYGREFKRLSFPPQAEKIA